ncbi:DNA topoisomerase 3-alpha [Terramyces sp. JEL0728]|nr:DNA topoisomerase 3-alpha [Terramyces sp. JEL0728]
MQQHPPSYQKPASDLVYHIYRSGLFSRDARITSANKNEQLFHVEFPFSFLGAWSVTIHWGANNRGPIAMEISKPMFSWDFTVIDHTTKFKTSLVRSGFFTRKHEFRGPDGKHYAWKGTGFGGDLKLIAYPEKVQVAYYDRAMFSFSKEGKIILCVAEKPSISKSVAQILSDGQFRTNSTGSKYIKNYEFNHMYQGRNCEIVMTALMGHLMETDFPPEYRQWNNFTTPQLFTANIIKYVKKDMKELEKNLKKEARNTDILSIWTDCDREGENIGAEVVEICRSVNPRIIVKRAKFSVVQKRDIMQAWNSMIELDMKAAIAVDARIELDLRIGAVFTRFQTCNLKQKFRELKEQKVLSYGPCQFPTLGFVVERFLKAKNFKEEPFWKIELSIGKGGIESKFNWSRVQLFDYFSTAVLFETCIENPSAIVTKVTSKPKEKWTPLPLTTVEMQKMGSRYLKMSSDKIMHIAEQLYNEGIISYPRTETDVFTDTFDLKGLIQKQSQDPTWGEYAQGLLDGKFKRPRKGKNNDQAHPPIHPVRAAFNLEGERRKVFEFVTRRFLACCSENAKGQETVINVSVADEIFVSTGLLISEMNYLQVYPYDKWSDTQVPPLIEGERIQPSALNLVAGSTSKPNMLTEADLIGIMDKSGIGTDATIHEHIKKILEREYVNKEGEYFYPTTLGMALVCGYDEMGIDLSLSKPDLRAQMESNMNCIITGTKTKEQVIQEVVQMYRGAYQHAFDQMDVLVNQIGKYMQPVPINEQQPERDMGEFVRHCILCKKPMNLRKIKPNEPRKMVGCTGFPTCKECVWVPTFVTEITVHQSKCGSCSRPDLPVHKVMLEFPRNAIPGGIESPREAPVRTDSSFGRLEFQTNNQDLSNTERFNPENSSNAQCPCQLPVVVKQVRKEGANFGREFFACSKSQSDSSKCNFFAWSDEPLENTRNCSCGVPSSLRTVRKDGPNCGKQFYCCSKPKGEGCDFFEWFGDPPRNDMTQSTTARRYQEQNISDGEARLRCRCELVAVTKKVFKEGPNNGREFYTCPKAGAKCDFFEWLDGEPNTKTSSNGSCFKCGQSGHFASNCNNNGGESSGSCYKCGDPGHFSNNCPQDGGSSRGRGRGRGRGRARATGGRGVSKSRAKKGSKIGKHASMSLDN